MREHTISTLNSVTLTYVFVLEKPSTRPVSYTQFQSQPGSYWHDFQVIFKYATFWDRQLPGKWWDSNLVSDGQKANVLTTWPRTLHSILWLFSNHSVFLYYLNKDSSFFYFITFSFASYLCTFFFCFSLNPSFYLFHASLNKSSLKLTDITGIWQWYYLPLDKYHLSAFHNICICISRHVLCWNWKSQKL